MSSTLLNADTGQAIGDSHPLPVRIVASGGRSGVPVTTTPTIASGASTTILQPNPRRTYLLVVNDTAGSLALSLSGDALSGSTPSAIDRGLLLPAGASYETPAHYCPTGAITAYQASGAPTNGLTVVEGSSTLESEGGVPATTTPMVASATSTPILAANGARRYLLVQNGTAGAAMISLSGAILSGVVPTATNAGIALPPGGSYESSPGFVPIGAVTAYQASGAATNAIVVVEG